MPTFYTFTAADAGTHTFSSGLAFFTAGSQSFTVSNPLMAAATSAVAVNPAAASTFSFGVPDIATAGTSFTFTVTALDAFGNVATGYTRTVSFTTPDGQALLPGNYTFGAADAGTHTFSATLKTATFNIPETTITGADTGNASLASTSAGILVFPGAAQSFRVYGLPTSMTAGGGGQVSVESFDAFGNLTLFDGTVHFTSSDPQAILPPTCPSTAGFR